MMVKFLSNRELNSLFPSFKVYVDPNVTTEKMEKVVHFLKEFGLPALVITETSTVIVVA